MFPQCSLKAFKLEVPIAQEHHLQLEQVVSQYSLIVPSMFTEYSMSVH
jgi:hypothetical protein